MTDALTPQDRAKELLAKLRENKPTEPELPPAPTHKFADDLIPDVEDEGYPRSELDVAIDNLLNSVTIDEAYRKWCGKMNPVIGNKKESIMISCPIPGHADRNPSAWMNIEKNTWYCAACQQGGDGYDIAAWHFGYSVPNYKSDGSFPQLRKAMAESLGLSVVKGHDGVEYPIVPGEPAPELPVEDPTPEPTLATVTHIPISDEAALEIDEEFQENLRLHQSELFIDWENIIPENTFLYEWMKACTIDDLPPEYYFWLGLQALGFAGRTDVLLDDFRPVKPNINVVLYGPTGSGKSRSVDPYSRLLRESMPFDPTDVTRSPSGVSQMPVPGSSEALIDLLRFDILDPATNKPIGLGEVTGLLKFEEFASFISKASRAGSSLKEIMIELFDVTKSDITIHSRTHGRTTARNPYVQVVTTTQPSAIHAFLRKTDSESGFLNRWIFATGLPRVSPIPYGLKSIDIGTPAQLLKVCRHWSKSEHLLTLDGPALDVWVEFFNREIAPQRTGVKNLDSIMSRVELFIKKIIVLLSINEMEEQPTEAIVKTATSLYPYLVTSFGLVSGDIAHTDSTACQEAMLEGIKDYETKYSKSPTRRDIVRILGRRFEIEVIEKTLKIMISLELVLEVKPAPGQRGRPTMRYTCGD